MGFLASLFGRGQQSVSPPTSGPAGKMCLIDYAHESGGVFYHGTLSLIDGKLGVTWTVDDKSHKQSQDIAMTEERFRDIWDSLNDIPDFKCGASNNPNHDLDPSTHHIVGVVFSIGGEKGMRTHMIPSASSSIAFKEWLAKIGYPPASPAK